MKINYGKVLIWSAIIVAVPRWAGAFIAADVSEMPQKVSEVLHYANLVAGVGMGFLEVVASAYLLEAWGKMKPKASHNAKSYSHKWKVLTGFVIGLFALMPFILAPYIVSRMTDVTIAQALGNSAILSYGWAVAVVLSPAFIVGGVAVANEDLMETKEASPVNQPKQSRNQTENKRQVVSKKGETIPETHTGVSTKTKADIVESLLMENPKASNASIGRAAGTTGQYVGQIRKELNGTIKETS